MDHLKADITDSSLCNDPCSDLDDLAKFYDYTLSHILEKHAPVQKKAVVVRPRIPWFNEELKRIKAKRRKLEKVMLRSKCQSDKEAYHRARNRYTASLNNAKRKTTLNLLTNVQETHENFLRSRPHAVTHPRKTPSLLMTILGKLKILGNVSIGRSSKLKTILKTLL